MATKKEMYATLLTLVSDNAELTEFINHEIELLNKKSGSSRKPTKTQVENELLKSNIVDYLANAEGGKTVKDITTEISSLNGLSNQKVTHLLTALVNDGVVAKEYVKKVPYFTLVGEVEVEDEEQDEEI